MRKYLLFCSLSMMTTLALANDQIMCENAQLENEYQDIQDIIDHIENFKCPQWIMEKKNLPPCPVITDNGKKTLPETYPKAVVFFSDSLAEASVQEAILKAIKDDPKRLPVFVYSSSYPDRFLAPLIEKHPDIKWNEHFVQDGPPNTFVRDEFGSRVDSKGNLEVFSTRDKFSSDTFHQITKCGITVNQKKDSRGSNAELSGNFLTFLPEINISTQLSNVHKASGYTEENTINFPALSNVQHIDEILQPIKLEYDSKGCPEITALIASPKKTMDLLKKSAQKKSDQYFFHSPVHRDDKQLNITPSKIEVDQIQKFKSSNKQAPRAYESMGRHFVSESSKNEKGISGGFNEVTMIRSLCNEYYNMPASDDINIKSSREDNLGVSILYAPTKHGPLKDRTTVELKPGYTQAEYDAVMAKANTNGYKYVKNVLFNQKGYTKYCENLTAKDVYQVMNNSLKEENDELQENVNLLKNRVAEKIKEKYPHCSTKVDWIDAPVIKQGKAWVLPNVANAMPINNKTISLPEPYSPLFKDYLEKQFKDRDMTPVWFDTFGLNNSPLESDEGVSAGNLHCATNSIPICKPN